MSKAARKPVRNTRPGDVPPEKDRPDKYMCARCGKMYVRQKANFHASQSPLFRESGYLPVCKNCMDSLYDHYREVLGSGSAAMERLCLKFDIYWNPDIWGMINKINTSASRVGQYIGKTFLIRYIGKTYDDTLDERGGAFGAKMLEDFAEKQVTENAVDDDEGNAAVSAQADVTADTVLFWGSGYDIPTYRELNLRYDRWTAELEKPLPAADEALYKQIAIQEMLINRAAAVGEDVTKGQNALNTLLGSLRLKPSQKKAGDDSADLETTPLGVWARRWEEQRPIPEYEDVKEPKLVKYITTWFMGHAAKCLGLKNMYSQVYEEEIAKYRVERPEFEDEDDERVLEDIVVGSGDE